MTSWRLRLLLACLTCLSLSSGSSLTSAAAHGGPSCRPAVLTHGLRLRGGQEAPPQPLTLRLNSRDGIKRIKTPGGHITLSMLQQIIRTQLHIPPSKQHVSLQAGGDLLDMSGEQTLAELGLKQGSMLHLASNIGVDTVSADKAARRASSTSRRVSMDVTADKTLLKVALVPAPAAPCQFVSIDARAWQNFAAYLIDTEMELMRVALLFGRVTTGDGVQVSRGTWPHRASAPAHQRATAQWPPPHSSLRLRQLPPSKSTASTSCIYTACIPLRLHMHTHTHMHVHTMFMYVAGGRLLRAAYIYCLHTFALQVDVFYELHIYTACIPLRRRWTSSTSCRRRRRPMASSSRARARRRRSSSAPRKWRPGWGSSSWAGPSRTRRARTR